MTLRTALLATAIAWASTAHGQSLEPLIELVKFLNSLPAWVVGTEFPINPPMVVWPNLPPKASGREQINEEHLLSWTDGITSLTKPLEEQRRLTGWLARESKPLTDRIIAWQQARPKTVVNEDLGGVIGEYVGRWAAISSQGGSVEVLGTCASACTLVTSYISKDKLCFGRDAVLMFHMARYPDGRPALGGTQWMINQYPDA
jgi:hypothetical protein